MKKFIILLVGLLAGLIFAQVGQLQPIKPNIPFVPTITVIQESQIVTGPYGSALIRHLERIADHLTNICEKLYFMQTGKQLKELLKAEKH